MSLMICSTSRHRQRGVRLLLLVAGAVLACVLLYFFRAFFFFLFSFFHFMVYSVETVTSILSSFIYLFISFFPPVSFFCCFAENCDA